MKKMSLDCSKCGGTLEITDQMSFFECQHCGTPYLVESSDGGLRIQRLEARVDTLEDTIPLKIAYNDAIKQLVACIADIQAKGPKGEIYKEGMRSFFEVKKALILLAAAKENYVKAGGTDEAILESIDPLALEKQFKKDLPHYDHELIVRQQAIGGLQLITGHKKFLLGIRPLAYVTFSFGAGRAYHVSAMATKNGQAVAQEIKAYLDAYYERSPVAPAQISPQLAAQIQQGRKIEAIKLYREETGAGLAEAKEAVEALIG